MQLEHAAHVGKDKAGCNHDGAKQGAGQVPQQAGGNDQHQADDGGTHDAGNLRARTGRLGHRRARGTAADGGPLEQTGANVSHPDGNRLVILADAGARTRRQGAREHAGIGERQQGNDGGARQQLVQVVPRHQRQMRHRQPLRQTTEHTDVCRLAQVKPGRDGGGRDHRNEHTGPLRAPVAQRQDQCQAASANGQRHAVDMACRHALPQRHGLVDQIVAICGKAEHLGQRANDDRQRNGIQKADADRPGKQIRQDTEARKSEQQ